MFDTTFPPLNNIIYTIYYCYPCDLLSTITLLLFRRLTMAPLSITTSMVNNSQTTLSNTFTTNYHDHHDHLHPSTPRIVFIYYAINTIKTELNHLIDNNITIYSKPIRTGSTSTTTPKPLNLHQIAMGTASHALNIFNDNTHLNDKQAIILGMMRFNQLHHVRYFMVDENTVI